MGKSRTCCQLVAAICHDLNEQAARSTADKFCNQVDYPQIRRTSRYAESSAFFSWFDFGRLSHRQYLESLGYGAGKANVCILGLSFRIFLLKLGLISDII